MVDERAPLKEEIMINAPVLQNSATCSTRTIEGIKTSKMNEQNKNEVARAVDGINTLGEIGSLKFGT